MNLPILLLDTFYLGRLGEVAASTSLTRGFNGPQIFVITLSVYDVMRNKHYISTKFQDFDQISGF